MTESFESTGLCMTLFSFRASPSACRMVLYSLGPTLSLSDYIPSLPALTQWADSISRPST